MSLRFLLGHGNCDLQASAVDEAVAFKQAHPQGKVFFLVPNYNKFVQEQELLQGLKQRQQTPGFSTIDIQVFSFYRLAWYFLQQTGQLTENTISETGSLMILRQVLGELSEDLVVFKSEIQKAGFVRQLLDFYQELTGGNLTPADLLANQDFTNLTGPETAKWQDEQAKLAEVAKILTAYQKALNDRDLQVEDPLAVLVNFLQGNLDQDLVAPPDLSETLFIAYGFEELYAQEVQLLQVLLSKADLTMTLLLDRQYTTAPPSSLDLFHATGKIFYQLTQAAQQANATIAVLPAAKDCTEYPHLVELERFWRLTQNQGQYRSQLSLQDRVHLWKAVTPEEEIRQITAEIKRLLSHDPKLRLKDIQVVTNDLETYGELIPHLFQQAELPFYIDQKATMDQHPLVEFLRTLLDLPRYHYRLEDILQLLKSELFLPKSYLEAAAGQRQQALNQFRRDVDLTENLALKQNFQGYYWLAEQDWPVVRFDFENALQLETGQLPERSNRLRRAFRDQVGTFITELTKAKTGRAACVLLYQFLLDAGVADNLLYWRDEAVKAGQLENARNHEQTWSSLMALMDEYVDIYGEEAFDFELFQEVFSAGLENTAYGKIPATIDQIQINQLTLSRPRQCKVTFAIGLNETNFPQTPGNPSLLTDEERSRLNQVLPEEKFIKEGAGEQNARSPLIAYKLFLSATEQLYLSYAANYDTQQNIQISPYLRRFQTWLKLPLEDRGLLTPGGHAGQYLASYRSAIGQLNNLYRQCEQEKLLIPHVWQRVEQALQESPVAEIAKRAFAGRSHQNLPLAMDPNLAQEVYGQDIYASVSRLESFYECEYRYFAAYGLRLKERELYGMDTLMTGSLFHDSLDRFLKAVSALGQDLTALSEEQRQSVIEELLQALFTEPQYQVLQSSARMEYLRYRLEKTIKKMTWTLQEQGKRTKMRPVQTEVLFGQIAGKEGIPGLELPMKNGGKLHVRGKIDRVDALELADEAWLAVVDYKSGDKQFNLMEAYYGLAMQLLTYLDVALRDADKLIGTKEAHPAGAYYLRIHDPIQNPEEWLKQRPLDKYKLKGFYAKNGQLYPALDTTLQEKEASQLYPITKDAKGIVKPVAQNKNFYSEDEIHLMQDYNRLKMQQAADTIVTGEIALNPYLSPSGKRACSFCPFRSLCTFDVMLQENDYHRLRAQDKENLLKEMEEALKDE